MLCPYCHSGASLKDNAVIYGKSYGLAWICNKYPECDSYVGCHPGTDIPLGRMANKELRKAKMAAHKAFDALWKSKIGTTRKRAYAWLAGQLKIHEKSCHIGNFDVALCEKVIEVCRKKMFGNEDN